jgi:peptide/nickel transport system substrate-binding protein
VDRQPRTLLTLLLALVVAGTAWLLWRDLRPASSGGDAGGPPTPSGVDTPARPARGGSITTAVRAEPRSFNRIAAQNASTELFSFLTQGKLVRINRATGDVEPWLAERWDTSPDGLTYTFALRRGLVWSDGVPFTAGDVVFSFQAAYDRSSGSPLATTLSVGGKPLRVSSPAPDTVVVTYPGPFGPGLRLLDNLTIAPKHKLEPSLKSGTFAQAWSPATPPAEMVSLGPFKLTRYDPGQRLVFDRNPQYWRRSSEGTQLPYLDQVIVEIIPDQNAESLRLQAGQLDVSYYPVRPEDLSSLRRLVGQGRMQLFEMGVSVDPDSFFFNLRPSYWAKDPRGAWMSRKEFRQAISHAVDREAFANTVFLGAVVPIWGPITSGNTTWFSPNVKRYPYSLEAARKLLAGLGLSNRDSDPWLEDERGTEARFSVITVRNSTTLERTLAVLRDDLQQVGVAMDVVPLEFGDLIQQMQKGTFDAQMFNFAATAFDPAMNQDFWLSSGAAHVWNIGQASPALPWERRIDELMNRMSATLDLPERQRLFLEVQQIFAEELPILYFAAPRLYMGASTRITNLTPAVLRPQLVWSIDTIAVRDAGGQGAGAPAPSGAR